MKEKEKSHEERMRELDESIARLKSNILTKDNAVPIPTKPSRFKFWKKHPSVTQQEHYPKAGGIIVNVKDKFAHNRTWLIEMYMRTGKIEQFRINTKEVQFDFQSGTYIIDPAMSEFISTAGLPRLKYHQDLSLPFKGELKVTELKDAISLYGEQNDLEVENAINPYTLKRFMEAKVAEQVMKGQAIDEFLRMESLKTWIIIILNALILIIVIKASGILKSIHIPGLGG